MLSIVACMHIPRVDNVVADALSRVNLTLVSSALEHIPSTIHQARLGIPDLDRSARLLTGDCGLHTEVIYF